MRFLDLLIRQDGTLLYLLNIVILVSLIAGWGLLARALLRNQPTGLRSTVLSTALALLGGAPMIPGLARTFGFAGVTLPWSIAATPGDATGESQNSPANPAFSTLEDSPHYEEPATDLLTSLDIAGRPGMTPPRILVLSLLGLWALGSMMGLYRVICGHRLLAHVLRTASPAGTETQEAVSAAAGAVGLRTAPSVVLSDRVSSPFSVGLLEPTIVLPATQLEPHALAAVLRHECGHFLHRHHLVGHLQNLVDLLWWWHPLVRGFNHELRNDQEELCDRHALTADISPSIYAQCLTSLATRVNSTQVPLHAACLIVKQGSLEGRIRRIIHMKNTGIQDLSLHHRVLGCVLVASTVTMAVACTLAPAQSATPSGPQAKPATRPEAVPENSPQTRPAGTPAGRSAGISERRLETYDFYKLMVQRGPKVKHDLKRAIEAATAVYSGKEIPRQALSKAMHLRFATFLQTILQLGKDVEIVPGQNGHLVVLATPEKHRVLSVFRTISMMSLLDKPTLIPLRFEALQLTPRAFGRYAKPLLKKQGIPIGDEAAFSTVSRSTQQRLFASLSGRDGIENLASLTLAAKNLTPCRYSQIQQTSYIKDFKVSIANAKAIADPIVGVVKHGRSFTLTPVRVDAKQLAVLFEAEQIHLKMPIPRFSTSLRPKMAPVTIQLPELETTRHRSVFRLPDPSRTGLFITSKVNEKRLIIAVTRKQ